MNRKNGMLGQAAIESSRGSTARTLRGQAAMEYLMTYGWALLVIVIVIAILLIINPFSAPQGCRFDDLGFSCTNPVADTAGNVYLRITNAQSANIILVGATCTTDKAPTAPSMAESFNAPMARQQYYDIQISCNPNSVALQTGQEFSGKLWIFWNTEDEASAGIYPQHVSSASFVTKVGA